MTENLKCLDHYRGPCEGEVQYRIAMSGTGRSFPRCEHHFDLRWQTQQRISRDYGVPLIYDGSNYDSED